MSEKGNKRLDLKVQGQRRSLPLLAALLLLLAAWFAWSGYAQWKAGRVEAGLVAARDAAVTRVQQALSAQGRELARRAASPAVQAALAAGDVAAAAMAIGQGWTGVEQVQVYPASLEAAYADATTFGYGRLALLETAALKNAPVARVVRNGKQAGVGVAVAAQGQLVHAAFPLALASVPVQSAPIHGTSYLALRQGSFTVVEAGDAGLANAAEAMGRPVGDTGLRVVAAAPDMPVGPMGLGAIPCAVVAALLATVALLSLMLAFGRLRMPQLRRAGSGGPAEGEPTFEQAIREVTPPPPPLADAPADDTAAERTPAGARPAGQAQVDPGIFRAYDIRGVVGKMLTVATAELIGQAVGSLMAEQGLRDVVVGRDGRLSGPELSAGVIEGLRRAGINVIDIGLAPTPVCYFAAYHLNAGSCVAVTGSHNPPDYNGFKIVVGGDTLSGAAITALYTRISEGQLHAAPDAGTLVKRDVAADYIDRIAGDVQLARPLKVVVDAGNGVGGEIAPALMEAIGAEVIPLYCDVDGTFPNHHPDPSEPHNLEDLAQTVKRFDADIGVAFDGDADRLGVVTREGAVIFADRVLMLFAADVLERNPGAMVIYDVKCTGKLQGWVLRHGGTPLMWQTGHSLIKAKMRESGAELAGEMSGHFFFQERWYGFDDGLYAAARLLEILAARDETPSQTLAALPDGVSTPELKVPVDAGPPHAIVKLFVDNAHFDGARLSTIDGLRADWDDGWGLLRASNTTPVLVLRFEGDNPAALERIQDVFRSELKKVAPELKLTF